MATPDFFAYRRNLPHWRLTGAVYFVTWRIHSGQSDLKPAERDLVASGLLHFNAQRYRLYAYVVMNDHVHVLVQPLAGHSLESIVQSWKSFTARVLQKAFGRIGAIWQREYFDRIVRDEDEFWEKVNYMMNNPLKRWPGTQDYVWAKWFLPG